ncbi:MAG: PilZ domain-containing protein, partial [Ketobacter sp.]
GEKLLCRLLLKALYVASLNRTLDMGYQDLKDLDAHQSRLLEIAAVLPKLDTHPDSIPVHEYKKDIDERFSALLEQLAKNTVKAYPERDKRYTVLQQYGFYLDYVDEKKVGLVMPVLISAGSLLASCTLTIMVALLLFDTLGVSRRSGHWFELQRIFNWAFGGWISYSIAVAFGLFFNESMRRKLGQKSLALYFLAFVFATLGSCIFFILTRESFSPPHVWLAISFGLVSVVAIKSRDRDYLERQSVIKKALQLSLWYGLASAILQLMVHVEFRGLENTTLTNMIAFFLFGMVRGGMVAFVVAYIFMEYERLGSYDARRKFPRIPFRKKIDGDIGGNTTEVFVKDLSEQGALLRVAANVSVSEGESVALKFSFADIPGKIIAVKSHLARVKFTAEEPQIHQLQSFINKRVAVS